MKVQFDAADIVSAIVDKLNNDIKLKLSIDIDDVNIVLTDGSIEKMSNIIGSIVIDLKKT